MKHELYYDGEKQVIVLRIKGEFKIDEARETLRMMEDLTGGMDSILVLTDMSEAPARLDRDVRELMKDITKKINIAKTALVMTNPAVRMVSKIVVSAMGNSDNSGFFKTEEEAMAWLKGE
jgi:hypothetical protein